MILKRFATPFRVLLRATFFLIEGGEFKGLSPSGKPFFDFPLRSCALAFGPEETGAVQVHFQGRSPSYDTTSSTTRKLFEEYELKSGLEKIEPLSLTDGEAKVKFVQVTQKISGPAFRDNRVMGVHTLRKDGGIWKILSTEATAVVYLDEPL